MADVKISELGSVPSGVSIDNFKIPLDDGQNTYTLSVEAFNERGTTSAQNYAAAAANSADTASDKATESATSATDAQTYKNQALAAKTAAETAQGYAESAQTAAESAKADAIAAKNTISTSASEAAAYASTASNAAMEASNYRNLAEAAATAAAQSASYIEAYGTDSEAWATGQRDTSPVPSSDITYHNNSKYYSEQAASSASSASNSADAAAASASAAATYTAKAPYIGANGHWYVWDATNNQYVDTNINATGPAGNGIASVAKTGSSGKVDTYTITFTDGTTFSYTVTNGEDGQGSGDMLMTDYDHDQDVYNAGGIPAYVATATTGKADKVSNATNGNLASLDNNGNLADSGVSAQSVTGKMNTDGTNGADVVKLPKAINTGASLYQDYPVTTMAKDAGSNQPLIITISVDNGFDIYNGVRVRRLFANFVNADERVYVEDYSVSPSIQRDIVIDSVTNTTSGTAYVVTVTAHFVEDFAEAYTATSSAALTVFLPNKSSNNGNVIGVGSSALSKGFAEGSLNYATGMGAHAEGMYNFAYAAHAEGYKTLAGGEQSHTEGYFTSAVGNYSHVEGQNNFTGENAVASSVTGMYNKSEYANQHVSGKYNSNKATTLLEVGNGTANNARSNAFEVYDTGYISQNNGTDKYKFAKSGGLDGFYDGSGNFHPFEPLYLEQNVTLSTSADTTVTFTNAAIATTSRIDCYTSEYGIIPTNVVATTGSCTVTFKKVSTASTITVGIEVKN